MPRPKAGSCSHRRSRFLFNLGKADATGISAEDTSDTVKIFSQTRFNGDGIIPAEAAEDGATAAVINDIIACLGAETDRSGKPGIGQAKRICFSPRPRRTPIGGSRREANAEHHCRLARRRLLPPPA